VYCCAQLPPLPCTRAHTHTLMRAYTHALTYARTHAHTHTHSRTHARTHTHTHTHMHAHTYTHARLPPLCSGCGPTASAPRATTTASPTLRTSATAARASASRCPRTAGGGRTARRWPRARWRPQGWGGQGGVRVRVGVGVRVGQGRPAVGGEHTSWAEVTRCVSPPSGQATAGPHCAGRGRGGNRRCGAVGQG